MRLRKGISGIEEKDDQALMLLSVGIIVVTLLATLWKPGVGLAVATNGYLIRAALSIQATPQTASAAPDLAPETDDPVLAVGLPAVVFLVIAIKSINTLPRYRIYAIDVLLFALGFVLIFGVLYAPDFEAGAEIALRYFALGASFYFFGRLMLTGDAKKAEENLNTFLATTWASAILLGAGALLTGPGLSLSRFTLGSAHPVPFSLLLGTALIINLYWIARMKSSVVSVPVLLAACASIAFLTFIFVASNTRGTLIALAVSLLLVAPSLVFQQFSFRVVTRFATVLLLVGGSTSAALWAWQPALLERLLEGLSLITAANKGESITERLVAQDAALQMFRENVVWGVGTGGYAFHYSFLAYAHNMALEIAAEQGILGIFVLSLLLCTILAHALFVLKVWRRDPVLLLLLALLVFNLVEAQFSFTLWMHKNLYLMLGFLVARSAVLPSAKMVYGSKLEPKATTVSQVGR
jgi:O-antigen ligase